MGVSGQGQYDIWHIIQGILQQTYARLRLSAKRKEGAVSLRAFCGPWQSQAFWGQFMGAKKLFFKAGWRNPCYGACFPMICKDRGYSFEKQCTPGFAEWLFSVLPEAEVLQHIGTAPVLGRWGNFETKFAKVKQHRGLILAILLFLGIQRGWFKKVSQSPLFKIVADNDDTVCGTAAHLWPIRRDPGHVPAGIHACIS